LAPWLAGAAAQGWPAASEVALDAMAALLRRRMCLRLQDGDAAIPLYCQVRRTSFGLLLFAAGPKAH
jgi:hypothetical protein